MNLNLFGRKRPLLHNAAKKRVAVLIILVTLLSPVIYAQDSIKASTSPTLLAYFSLKNALVTGNANVASLQATELIKTINGDNEVIKNEGSKALLKDATFISVTKDLKKQREAFADLSVNMFALAKAIKLTTGPLYYAYCPMKKAYWLSNSAAIKNPYYGNAMLTCGKVEETLKLYTNH